MSSTTTTTTTAASVSSTRNIMNIKDSGAVPLYDMFFDLPHPCASSLCPKPFVIESPLQASGTIASELNKNLLQIVRFAFPDYDESIEQQIQQQQQQQSQQQLQPPPIDNNINKYDVYAMQSKSFMSFTFSLQLSSGIRVHGHVRRYLPPHLGARSRYDTGRRGERALCILTRATGADPLYSSILKTIEAISSQQAALSSKPHIIPHAGEPQKHFLYQITRYQQHLATLYGTGPEYAIGKPLIAGISCIEVGEEYRTLYKDCDVIRFIVPTTLLQKSSLGANGQQQQPGQQQPVPSPTSLITYNGSILPLLRCVGVCHSLRIMAALLSERRVIFVSSSPTRLAACSNAALSMLSCGLLQWQHLYIPVLPPHLWPYLAAPYPYLIGILSSAVHKLDRTDGLGEVLMIQLDTNQLETRGMETSTISQRLPDLFMTNSNSSSSQDIFSQQAQQMNTMQSSASEQLAQDLFEVLKNDKKILYGLTGATFAANVVGETATKATIAVKNTFLKLRDKSRQYLQKSSGEISAGNTTIDTNNNDETQYTGTAGTDGPPTPENSMASDYIYTEGCHNDICEEDCRIAFTVFFLCLIGDLKWYLTTNAPNTLPVLDRNKFIQQKRSMGDREGTPMYQLLQNFVQTQMLEEFAKARIEDSVKSIPIQSQDTPLFLQCTAYQRQNRPSIEFTINDVKRLVHRIVETNPLSASRVTGNIKSNARRNAMSLTSNKGPEPGTGDVSTVMANLVEECRESTSILSDVMSVIWLRLRDSKGMQWKHALQALQLLRSLLLHGPLAAISEAVDGLDKIRALKYYDNIRPVSVLQVRSTASTVYRYLVDRALLFQVRRSCIDRRRQLLHPSTIKIIRDVRALCTSPFRAIHAAFHPNAGRGTIVQMPPPNAAVSQTMVRDGNHNNTPIQQQQQQRQMQTQSSDFFGATISPTQPVPQPTRVGQPPSTNSSAANDLLGIFDSMAVSKTPSTTGGPPPPETTTTIMPTANTVKVSNPFDAFTPAATTNNVPMPLVAVPPSQPIASSATVPSVAPSHQQLPNQPFQGNQQQQPKQQQQPSMQYAVSQQASPQRSGSNPFAPQPLQQPTFAIIPPPLQQQPPQPRPIPLQQPQNMFVPPNGQGMNQHPPTMIAARGLPVAGQPQQAVAALPPQQQHHQMGTPQMQQYQHQQMQMGQMQYHPQQLQYPGGAMVMPQQQQQVQQTNQFAYGMPQQQQQQRPNTSQFDPFARK